MPIIYIHGVAVRSPVIPRQIDAYLRRYIAPELSSQPDAVRILYVPWGSDAATFAWNGASRPKTALLKLGSETVTARELAVEFADGLQDPPKPEPVAGGLSSGQTSQAADRGRLKDLSPDELGDLAAAMLASPDEDVALLTIAADEAAHSPEVQSALAQAGIHEEADIFEDEVSKRYRALLAAQGLSAQGDGLPPRAARLTDRLQEALGRTVSAPAYVLSRAFGELRRPLNEFVTRFLGDVFVYLARERTCSDHPGPITSRLMKALREAQEMSGARGGEGVVVLSHSMGGQIVYDAISHYLPRPECAGLRVDFWCATASQVGLFEELKLFRASTEAYSAATSRVPSPDRKHLGTWWNVWDYNDFISYTGAPIFEGIDDGPFDSGASLLTAHSAYLDRPSFYRRFAEKVRTARSNGWNRP